MLVRASEQCFSVTSRLYPRLSSHIHTQGVPALSCANTLLLKYAHFENEIIVFRILFSIMIILRYAKVNGAQINNCDTNNIITFLNM